MTELTVTTTRHRDHWVLALSGELDTLSCPRLQRELDTLLAYRYQNVIVDINDLRFCDAAGLRLFLSGTRRFFEAGGWLRLCGVCPCLLRLADVLACRSHLTFSPACAETPAALCDMDDLEEGLPASTRPVHGAALRLRPLPG
jgi:anti-anti-sigma factor